MAASFQLSRYLYIGSHLYPINLLRITNQADKKSLISLTYTQTTIPLTTACYTNLSRRGKFYFSQTALLRAPIPCPRPDT
ncbi:hypothetical protein XFF6992_290003 [Xanthomonas citri pv. fuscans]|nr:hypothetical protein XFF6992_290003 [Xanthomonas citri pv. fuscans]SOO33048.1 hypothetical protein XFF6994_2600003 [Xanthomonas citri pv. fuscans]